MKKSLSLLGLGVCLFALPVQADDFQTYPRQSLPSDISDVAGVPSNTYVPGTPAQNWITNSVDAMGLASAVGLSTFSHPSSTDQWVRMGGLLMNSWDPSYGAYLDNTMGTQVEVWTPLSYQSDVKLSVLMGVVAMSDTNDNTSSFGWTFRNSIGERLFAVMFNAYGSSTQLSTDWIDAAGTHQTGDAIVLSGEYLLNVSLDLSGAHHSGTPTYTFSLQGKTPADKTTNVGPLFTYTGAINVGSVDASNVGSVSATWVPGSLATTPAAMGYMSEMDFDNYIVSVPEPSSIALGLGGLGLLTMLRRRIRTA